MHVGKSGVLALLVGNREKDNASAAWLTTSSTVANNDIYFRETSIKPNPFDHSLILENLSGKYLINITDVNGKNVFTTEKESIDGEIVVNNLSNLPGGIYFITAEGESQSYFSKAVK